MGRVSTALVFAGGDRPRRATALRDLPAVDLVIAADSGLDARPRPRRRGRPRRRRPRLGRPCRPRRRGRRRRGRRAPPRREGRHRPRAGAPRRPRPGCRARSSSSAATAAGSTTSSPTCSSSAPRSSPGVHVWARSVTPRVTVVRDRAELAGSAGALVLPAARRRPGRRRPHRTAALPARRETCSPGSTRGVSNEFLATTAAVIARAGRAARRASPHSGKDA